jgi:hypothetical protein
MLPNDAIHSAVDLVVKFLKLPDLGRLGMTETRMLQITKAQKSAVLGNPALAWLAKKYKEKLRLPFVHFGTPVPGLYSGGVLRLTLGALQEPVSLHKFSMRQVVLYDADASDAQSDAHPWYSAPTTREGAMLEFAKWECLEQFYANDDSIIDDGWVIRVTFTADVKRLWLYTPDTPRCCWIRDQLNRKLNRVAKLQSTEEATSGA